jgi:N-acetylmuramoyl-L-alanine amidase
MFFVVKKKFIIFALVLILGTSIFCGTYLSIKASATPKPIYSIVIDAGHGGRDGGAVGINTGINESELNLKYAKTLEKLCGEFGIGVTMTRKDMNGLYEETASNKKKSEMEKRKSIINNSGADIMVSLHMNSFPLSSCSGAHVYYKQGSENGYNLAKSVQKSLCQSFDNAKDFVSEGDFFVLNTSTMPSILVECGFLSSPTEEAKLVSDDYCEKFCYSLLAGILSYFKM